MVELALASRVLRLTSAELLLLSEGPTYLERLARGRHILAHVYRASVGHDVPAALVVRRQRSDEMVHVGYARPADRCVHVRA